ncbi:hypothetical protein [Burkholderia pseudomultivorans]|uniref:hypothetical protein n=1 Tax=Burkholderia pseudomultivorans TaxID=1207504 RepID=UPI000AC26B6E|nr:hypothetical protein [Burkholderia pseudomultivorans]
MVELGRGANKAQTHSHGAGRIPRRGPEAGGAALDAGRGPLRMSLRRIVIEHFHVSVFLFEM